GGWRKIWFDFQESHLALTAFILNASLIDVPLGGYKFTWTDKWGSKISKLDRFLVSKCFYDTFPHITGVVLEKGSSDHRPILLREHSVDYGPIPFRFFHSWLEMEGFHILIVDTWKNDGIFEVNGLISFKKKLQNLKREPSVTTHAKFTARINKLLEIRQTIDSLLFKTINESTNQSSNSEIFCPEERIKELELRMQRRNNFEEELFKDKFPTEEELAYHKELLGEPQPPFSTLEPKIRRGDPWSLKIPCVIGTIYTGHAYIDLQSPVNIMSRAYYNKIREKSFQAQDLGNIIDSGLSEVVLGKPFVHAFKLTYDEYLGLIRFSQRDDEVVFRMPQRTKELDLVSSLEKDKFEAFFVENLKVIFDEKKLGRCNIREFSKF
ncbi:RNA-directed DNA polymerase, eukaryota, reverse transcriptase zinc-binding domain protein, partial [Tanacetum coccineum]